MDGIWGLGLLCEHEPQTSIVVRDLWVWPPWIPRAPHYLRIVHEEGAFRAIDLSTLADPTDSRMLVQHRKVSMGMYSPENWQGLSCWAPPVRACNATIEAGRSSAEINQRPSAKSREYVVRWEKTPFRTFASVIIRLNWLKILGLTDWPKPHPDRELRWHIF